MKFKDFIKSYGVLGYPIKKIKSLLGDKSEEFEKLLDIEMKKHKDMFNKEMDKLTSKNIDDINFDDVEKDAIESYINHLRSSAVKIFNLLDSKYDLSTKEYNNINDKCAIIFNHVNDMRNELRRNGVKGFLKKYGGK